VEVAMTRTGPFENRTEAGQALAEQLAEYAGRDDVVVLALPRGGVPVAAPVAAALSAPLDVLVVRKLGLPGQPELAMGAMAGVGSSVEVVRNERVLAAVAVSESDFDAVYRRELDELRRREEAYREGRPAADVAGRVVVVVDDGLATGSTMLAAVAALQQQRPAKVVVAVPVGAADTCQALSRSADEVVCTWTPDPFYAVGQGYHDFGATQDDEVRRLLHEAAAAGAGAER
jgi:putative phosphoribosyl transferase